jgi:hypothetical protein
MNKNSLDNAKQVETVALAEIEELEEKIAPGRGVNHNETLVLDDTAK